MLETTLVASDDEEEGFPPGSSGEHPPGNKKTPKRYFPVKLVESDTTVWLDEPEHKALIKLIDYANDHGLTLKELHEWLITHFWEIKK